MRTNVGISLGEPFMNTIVMIGAPFSPLVNVLGWASKTIQPPTKNTRGSIGTLGMRLSLLVVPPSWACVSLSVCDKMNPTIGSGGGDGMIVIDPYRFLGLGMIGTRIMDGLRSMSQQTARG